jgi:hypothetical protein
VSKLPEKFSRDIEVEISGIVPATVKMRVAEDLRISEDLEREVDNTAAQMGYWAVLAEKAKTRHEATKLRYERWRATRERELKEIDGKKYKTGKDFERDLFAETKYAAFRSKINEQDEQYRIIKAIAKAFEAKKDLVQTKCSNRRSEIK